ncbi:hypothetical protein L2D14_00010 [Thalassospiraceae bacterium LMO-JJ14]|nr:hypothetical protein L2D14_00010 [Thalassospiraceae bacterium LMO-JJ14]
MNTVLGVVGSALVFWASLSSATADQTVAGEYHGIYAYCKGAYPCTEEDFVRTKNRPPEKRNDIALKLWQEDEEWMAVFSPPAYWKNFHEPKKAHYVDVDGNDILFKVARPSDAKTLVMKGVVEDGVYNGKIEYNGYIMHGRMTRN